MVTVELQGELDEVNGEKVAATEPGHAAGL